MTTTASTRQVGTLRVAAGCLLAGTVLYAVPTAVHGNPPVDSAEAVLEYVHERPSWRLVHLVNIVAVVLWAGAFSALAPVLAPSARAAARAVRVVFTASAAVFAVYFSIHAFGLTTAANQYFAAGADRAAVLERTEVVLILLGSTAFTAQAMLGASVAFAGFALTRSTALPGWWGWSGAVIGIGWSAGALLVDFAVIVPFTALAWVWTALLAVRLWRAAAPVDDPA